MRIIASPHTSTRNDLNTSHSPLPRGGGTLALRLAANLAVVIRLVINCFRRGRIANFSQCEIRRARRFSFRSVEKAKLRATAVRRDPMPPPCIMSSVPTKLLMPSVSHIVIVDNDAQIRGLLSSYLQSSGFRATAVADGKALDRLLNSKRVDLIVLDPILPGEDGLSICRRLRAEARVPVVIVTSRRSEIDRIQGLEVAEQRPIELRIAGMFSDWGPRNCESAQRRKDPTEHAYKRMRAVNGHQCQDSQYSE
jgi:CheY-like chemotaxis protein